MSLDPISPTQVNTVALCQRQWAWDRIDNVPRTSSPQAEDGQKAHKHLEDWFRFQIVPEGDSKPARVARAILAQWPHPKTIGGLGDPTGPDIESHLHVSVDGIPYHGFMDIGYWLGGLYTVGDHKTTSNLVWAKTEGDLKKDPQGLIYPAAILGTALGGDADEIRTRWVYGEVRSGKTKVVESTISRQAVIDGIRDHVAPHAERILEIREGHKSGRIETALQLPPTIEACDRFGGCQYRDRCGISPRDRLVSLMSAQSLKERLAERAAAAKNGAPDPINPPESAKAPPAASVAKSTAPAPEAKAAPKAAPKTPPKAAPKAEETAPEEAPAPAPKAAPKVVTGKPAPAPAPAPAESMGPATNGEVQTREERRAQLTAIVRRALANDTRAMDAFHDLVSDLDRQAAQSILNLMANAVLRDR